jgi:hypothetical protein
MEQRISSAEPSTKWGAVSQSKERLLKLLGDFGSPDVEGLAALPRDELARSTASGSSIRQWQARDSNDE